MESKSLVALLRQSFDQHAGRGCLEVDGRVVTYNDMGRLGTSIAQAIDQAEGGQPKSLAAVLGYRSLSAYAGILGALLSGRGYVPLNPKFPLSRTVAMINLSGVSTLVVDPGLLELLGQVLPDVQRPLTVICPEPAEVAALASAHPRHAFVDADALPPGGDKPRPATRPEDIAYVMFTSGSTGVPKGVPVSNRNVVAYLEYVSRRYAVVPEDRLSQMFDLTFDLSVHDIFLSWINGACLCVVPEDQVIAPARFVAKNALTLWFSVPSVPLMLSRLRMLRPGIFPNLRYSLFCGEPLSSKLASAWQQAAPQSVVENLYGPTEATIAITHYPWDEEKSPGACVNGVVPIGWPFEGQQLIVADEKGNQVADGEQGELLIAGSQVTGGYLNNPEKTAAQFVTRPGDPDTIWYRTGDVSRRGPDGCLYYLGRLDDQVQIHGYRVELQEVDAALRAAVGHDGAVAVAIPYQMAQAEEIHGFVQGGEESQAEAVIGRSAQSLPTYMQPKAVHFIKELPRNANGKIDRRALAAMLEK